MFTIMVTLLIYLLVLSVFWLIFKRVPVLAQFGQIIDLIFAIIALIIILGALTGIVPAFPSVHIR